MGEIAGTIQGQFVELSLRAPGRWDVVVVHPKTDEDREFRNKYARIGREKKPALPSLGGDCELPLGRLQIGDGVGQFH